MQVSQNLPLHGTTIIFTTIPPASYLTPNKPYIVEVNKTKFKFISTTGSSTFENANAVKRSVWKYAE